MPRTPVRIAAIAVALGAAAASTPAGEEEARSGDYVFSLDGGPFTPEIVHLHGEPGKPRPGDVFHLTPYWIALGDEREVHLSKVNEEKSWESLRLVSGGRSRWVAVAQPRLVRLSDDEVRGLWAVWVETEGEWPLWKLEKLDLDRASITLSMGEPREKPRVIPPLPRGLRRLALDLDAWADLITYQELTRLRHLEFLELDGFRGEEFDLRILVKASRLRSLSLHRCRPESLGSLAALKELRYLDLSGEPRLRDLTALPYVAQLRQLRVLGTGVTRVEVDSFRKRHPGCEVLLGFDGLIQRRVQGTDRVRLRVYNILAPGRGNDSITSIEVADPNAVGRLAGAIKVGRALPEWNWSCSPYLDIGFHHGERLLTSATYDHGYLVGFTSPWVFFLTDESHRHLVAWLHEHGVKQPLEDLEDEDRRTRADRALTARATAGMSAEVAEAFLANDEGAFRTALAEGIPAAGDRARILLCALGAGNGPVRTLGWQEILAFAALRDLPRGELLPLAERALFDPDRRLRRGAVRFWETAGSFLRAPADGDHQGNRSVVVIAGGEADDLLASHKFEDLKQARAAMVAVELEARSAEVREQGLLRLRDWAGDFTPEEIRRRLLAGLRDPHQGVRRRAILVAGEMRLLEAEGILLDVLAGKTVDLLPLPEVPAGEAEDVDDGHLDAGGDAPAGDLAALALGYLGSQTARALLLAREKENDLCRVALAVAGDPGRLKAEDFRCFNQARQLAAVEAVARAKGRIGLEAALDYRQASHWWEEGRVAGKLRAMLLENGAPGAEELKGANDLEALRSWYRRHGVEYLSRPGG